MMVNTGITESLRKMSPGDRLSFPREAYSSVTSTASRLRFSECRGYELRRNENQGTVDVTCTK